jgi:hypothetical protein
MSNQSWQETLAASTVAGTLFNSYTTAKTVIPTSALVTVPAGYFTIGRVLKVDVMGGISNIVTTPGTITLQVMLGSVVVFTSGAIQLNATAHTVLPFRFSALLTCRAVGSGTSANFMGMGEVAGVMFTATAGQTDGANTQTILQVPATAPAVGTGFDSTAAQTIDFFAGFSISNAGNGIQVQQYTVQSLN